MQNLPLQSRNFFNLALMAPGMGGRNDNNTNIGRLGGGGSTNFQVDGIGVTDTGSNTIQFAMNVDAVAEVKVLTGSFQAEYGRAERHADRRRHQERHQPVPRLDLRRDPQLELELEHLGEQAERPSEEPNVVKEQDWGYTVGGPIGKPGGNNKLFFFFAQEWRPRETAGSLARFKVPTQLERQGDFSQSLDNNGVAVQPDPRREHQPAVHGDQHDGLLPGRRRRRPHPDEPAQRSSAWPC